MNYLQLSCLDLLVNVGRKGSWGLGKSKELSRSSGSGENLGEREFSSVDDLQQTSDDFRSDDVS